MSLSIGVFFVVVGAAAPLFTTLGKRPLTALFPVGNDKRIDFAQLRLSDNSNQYLMCPPDTCSVKPQANSPVFEISVDRLTARWRDVLAAQPHVEPMAEDKGAQQFDYVQRTARFRFPDIVTVRFISVSSTQSTLAIYSRSVYGKKRFRREPEADQFLARTPPKRTGVRRPRPPVSAPAIPES